MVKISFCFNFFDSFKLLNFFLDLGNNEASLYNLPYNEAWRFRVSIYDQVMSKWSKFSPPSDQLDLGTKLIIQLERVGLVSLKIKWKQSNNFTFNYLISRYIICISIDESPFIEIFDNKNLDSSNIILFLKMMKNFKIFESLNLQNQVLLEPINFEPYLPDSVSSSSEEECKNKCVAIFNCIQYVFYEKKQYCYLITKYNPVNGVNDRNAIVKSIKCNIYLL